MNNLIIDGITNIDIELIQKYWIYKHQFQRRRKRNFKWLISAVAACLILSICIPTVIIYTPVEYDLEYDSPHSNLAAWGKRNIWVYYTNGTDLDRERVRLPCSPYSRFVVWKHLNNIGDDVEYLGSNYKQTEEIEASDLERKYDFHLHSNKKAKKLYTKWISISKDIESYFSQHDKDTLMLSLVRTLTESDKIVYSDIYVIFE